jgi:hypothetical protein
MKFSKGIGTAAGLALAVAMASAGIASAANKTPSGNLNLQVTGYEVLTPSAGIAGQYTVNGIGQVIGDTGGSLSGGLTYTLVDVHLATEEVCNDTVTGTITPPAGGFASSDGSFTASLALVPGSGATADCEGATVSLLCNRTLLHQLDVNDLDAGIYRCITTSITPANGGTTLIDAASLDVTIDSVKGANAPNN